MKRPAPDNERPLREIQKALPALIIRAEATGNYFLAYLLEMALLECRRSRQRIEVERGAKPSS